MEDDDQDGVLSILGQIEKSTKDEGYTPGTDAFVIRRRQLQVAKCREIRGYSSCLECPYNEYCELYASAKRDAESKQ